MNPGIAVAMVCVGFIAFWISLIYFVSWISGWRSIAAHYGSNDSYIGDLFWCRSLSIARGSSLFSPKSDYGGSINYGPSVSGLYLKPILPFAFGHQALFIPWQDITMEERSLLGYKWVELTLAKVPTFRLKLSRGLFEKLVTYAGSRNVAHFT